MKHILLYFILSFTFSFLIGEVGYGQAIYTSIQGDDCPDENKFFGSCWEITGECSVEDPVVIRPIPPVQQHELTEGDVRVIGQMPIEVVDENGDTLTTMVPDYVVTVDGVREEYEVGVSFTVQAGDTIYFGDGTFLVAQPTIPDPEPIFEIGGTEDCQVIFVVEHEISIGNLHLKDNVKIQVNVGGKLVIDNLTQAGAATVDIIVDGGEIRVNRLVVEAATINTNNTKKTELNITLNNGGIFKVAGLIDLKNNTDLTIKGDGSGLVETEEIALNQGIVVNIDEGGGLKVNSETRINGNSTVFNIKGHFETDELTVAGGRDLGFNAIGNSTVTVHKDVNIRGAAGNSKDPLNPTSITFGGDSDVNIGGNLNVRGNAVVNFDDKSTTVIDGSVNVRGGAVLNVSGQAELDIVGGCVENQTDCEGGLFVDGNSKVKISDTSEVYVCGMQPSANSDQGVRVDLFCDEADGDVPCATYSGCRILPVNFIDIAIEHQQTQRFNTLSWSTSKEWENSHFEIERSIDGTKTFEKIGQVYGRGWTDEVTEYSYDDEKLPLSGGNVFYRLKQVDFNGKYEYSDISGVRVPNVHFTKGVWRAYPNPMVGSDFNLELVDMSLYYDEAITLRVFSSNISSNEMVLHSLHELNQTAASIMSNASKGLWIFEIRWGNKVEHIKVMKK